MQGTPITVTTDSDDSDGDVSSVANLLANPGPDGTISLREAILATNNEPGTYTIGFAAALSGSTITVDSNLPPLTGGGVGINGTGVTLAEGSSFASDQACPWNGGCGLELSSSSNAVSGLTISGFGIGVELEPASPQSGLPNGVTLVDNTLEGLTISNTSTGVLIHSSFGNGKCGGVQQVRCVTDTTWKNTTISGNTLDVSSGGGIVSYLDDSGDQIQQIAITNNTIDSQGANGNGAVNLAAGGDAINTDISDAQITGNTINGQFASGVDVDSGPERSQNDVVEHVQIANNKVHLVACTPNTNCDGVYLPVGSDALELASLTSPPRYPDSNLLNDVTVSGNAISGNVDAGIAVDVGQGMPSQNNHATGIVVQNNTIDASGPAVGVFARTSNGSVPARLGSGNQISTLTIDSNQIQTGSGPADDATAGGGTAAGSGGVVIMGAGDCAENNSLAGIKITQNSVDSFYAGIRVMAGRGLGDCPNRDNQITNLHAGQNHITVHGPGTPMENPQDGGIVLLGGFGATQGDRIQTVTLAQNAIDTTLPAITVVAGLGHTGSAAASTDTVTGVQITSNSVLHAPSPLSSDWSWVKGIDLIGGWADDQSATGNNLNSITLQGNDVAGVTNDVAVRSNLGVEATNNIAALGLHPPTLTVAKTGSGAGMIFSDSGGIDCGQSCSHEFDDLSQVTLTAQADRGSAFTGWSGGGCSGTANCTVTMDGDQTVAATFEAICVVPNVKGKSLSAARRAIKKAHCDVGKITKVKSSKKRKNHVISQSPKAGAHRTKGSKVALKIGKGGKLAK